MSDQIQTLQRPWAVEAQKIKVLYDELHVAIKTHDHKQILGVQLKMMDHLLLGDRMDLSHNIIEIYGKERLREVTQSIGKYMF